MDLYLYIIFGLILIVAILTFSMFIMYYKYILRKKWDKRASCIEMATDKIKETINQEISDLTADGTSIDDKIEDSIETKTLVQIIQQPKEHPIFQEPLPDDIHELFNPKLQPKNGPLVQFSERDLLSFPKTALKGNDMIKEIKAKETIKKRDNGDASDNDNIPLEVIRTNSTKRVGRSVVKYPNSSRETSQDPANSRNRSHSRNHSRRRSPSRARSEFDDRHTKFEHPKYRGKSDFEDYYLHYLVPTISAVVQQTLEQTINAKGNYVDQWVNNNEVTSVDGLQTPSLKSF
eukprot:NODE_172_length_14331_cov_0.709177.p6 type:complete len:290 gc:universal NODE_172_length_14331_cov_0.709177:11958-12827(+)